MDIPEFLFYCFLIILFISYFHTLSKAKFGRNLPGPWPLPIVGNSLLFVGSPEAIYRRILGISLSYKRLVAGVIGNQLTIFLFDPKDIEIVYKSKSVKKADEYRFFHPWLRNSIFLENNDQLHKQHKKMIQPAFRLDVLKTFIPALNKHSRWLVEHLRNIADDCEIDLTPHIHTMTTRSLLETQMGLRDESVHKFALEYSKSVIMLCRITNVRVYTFWMRSDFLFNHLSSMKKEQDKHLGIVRRLTQKVIQQKRVERDNLKKTATETVNEDETLPLLDQLIKCSEDGSMTDDLITDEITAMMFAGQDTSASTLGFVLSVLGYYQYIQNKVLKELDEVFGERTEITNVTYEELNQLKYLEAVIQESWRLYPPAPLMAKCTTQDIDIGDYILPKDSTLALILVKIQSHPDYVKDPEKFYPERFLEGFPGNTNPYSFMPFGAGSHSCVGGKYAIMGLKIMLVHIFRNFRVRSHRAPSSYCLKIEATLKRTEGFPVFLEKRQLND